MKRKSMWVLVCACLLAPSAARADDGGWLDWLYRLDTKLWGINTEFHVLCLDADRKPLRCEELFLIPKKLFGTWTDDVAFDRVKHEFNVRVGFYGKYGDVKSNRGVLALIQDLKALKLGVSYAYLPDEHIEVGLGLGLIQFRGDSLSENHWSALLTPLSVVYSPAGKATSPWGRIFLRGEASYITSTLTSGLFAGGTPSASEGEWSISFGTGIDLRRRRLP
jgi:hypothetical protein